MRCEEGGKPALRCGDCRLDNLAVRRPLSNGQYSIICTSLLGQTTKSETLLRHAVEREGGWTPEVRQRSWTTRPMNH